MMDASPQRDHRGMHAYSDQTNVHVLSCRISNDAYPMSSPSAFPGNNNYGSNFSLAASPDQYSLVHNEAPRRHEYRTSNASSVASSLVRQVMEPPPDPSVYKVRATDEPLHSPSDAAITPPPEQHKEAKELTKEFLNSSQEIEFMGVFVQEVAIWMDSFDKDKHFSRVIPLLALKSPMLMNAFLACGVMHLTLVNHNVEEAKALLYYDTATRQLLRSLQNPDRNASECATTAVVLNVYEIMSEKPNQRMSHIAGARALIRECGWNARSRGIGAACFWLNIGMEVLSCLSFNWQTAWDPDQWGLDLSFLKTLGSRTASPVEENNGGNHSRPDGPDDKWSGDGEEEVWVHRIFYIVARIANFRANIPKFQGPSPRAEQARSEARWTQWCELKSWCDGWHTSCPQNLHPFGYVAKSSKSLFPHVW